VPRAIAVARVEVLPAEVAAYIAAASQLAAALRVRGQHLWVFRHPDRPGAFLEFRESATDVEHVVSAPTPVEEKLTRALRALGSCAPGMDDLWLEVSLTEGRTFVDGSE
jgi:hypothetical protein